MECSVCNEAYNETDFKPHSLNPCGHCFCIKCINSLPNKVCPICRQSIQSTILNFAILEMVRDRIPIARPNLNFMSEINDMKKSLNGSLNKKQLEWRKYIDQMRERYSRENLKAMGVDPTQRYYYDPKINVDLYWDVLNISTPENQQT